MEAPVQPAAVSQATRRGRPYPLGATWDGSGVNFALCSREAERVELCLFDPKGRRELERIELAERTDFVWHVYLPEARPGQLYAYRVHGGAHGGAHHAPEEQRFHPSRTVLDPYARMIVGPVSAGAGRCQVVDSAFSWDDDRPPRTPWHETVLYEAHVKGLTRLHPEVPEALRGTYAALASEPVVAHLKKLGVTALELLPIHAFVDEKRLLQHGLRNYWGYSSIGYFAPEMRYSATGTLGELKTMVKTLHAEGIEVILDVVYNHTGEGDHHGPTLAFRGIDNAAYYRLDPEQRWRYVDYTGTGNTVNVPDPVALRLVMDSLRYWASEMHIDGFRFDLAAALGRGSTESGARFDRRSAFLCAVQQDPVLAQVKLIAEPWDLGEGGYQLGAFPPGWSEWNDRYRDTVRSYWRGDGGRIGELAARLAGSEEIFGTQGRAPSASVNFVTAHDGFTLQDLVSYNDKHNDANHEGNRDGSHHNLSWNCGAEGQTEDAAINDLRTRQKRNFLATLLFSRGVPMLLAGDELGRTQRGNNNAYCHDSELSWVDWDLDASGRALLEFASRLVGIRQSHAAFRKRTYERDIAWLAPHGGPLTEAEWQLPFARCLAALYPAAGADEEDLLLLLNAHDGEVAFTLPEGGWKFLLDTAGERAFERTYPLQSRSLALLSKAS